MTDPARPSEPLVEEVYDRLKAVAARYFDHYGGATLQPTALVHEAWLKLADARFADREHFCAVAARAMRQILVDRARARNRVKRGGGWERVTLSGVHLHRREGLAQSTRLAGSTDGPTVRWQAAARTAPCDRPRLAT